MANELTEVKFLNVTPPAVIVDNASYTTAEIDTIGFDYCTIVCQLGALDIAMTVLKVQECATSGGSFADVTGLVFGTSSDIEGSTSALPSATDDDGLFIFQIDMKGRERFLDVVATIGNGAAGGYLSVLAILSRAKELPTNLTGHGAVGMLRA